MNASAPSTTKTTLDERFQWAADQRMRLITILPPETIQHLYGLFKQARKGDNLIEEPPEHHRVDHAKWSAWAAVKGLSCEEAKCAYVSIVEEANAALRSKQKKKKESVRCQAKSASSAVSSVSGVLPMNVPQYPYPQIAEWTNHAMDIYVEEFGLEHLKERTAFWHSPKPITHESREKLEQVLNRLMVYFFNQADFDLPLDSYVVGKGTLTVDERVSELLGGSFQAGNAFPLQLKHKNVTRGNSEFERFKDDTSSALYRGSLKIELGDGIVFDLPMATSRVFYPNIHSFSQFTMGRDALINLFKNGDPFWYIIAVEARRCMASSYASVVYHAPIPRFFHGTDGKDYMAKFRMTPVGLKQEEGMLTLEQQRRMLREIDIRKPDATPEEKSYLAREYRQRLSQGSISYELEILISPPVEELDDFERWSNPMYPWDESLCRVSPLGLVDITEPVEHEENGAQLRFHPGAMPSNFFTPEPESLHDPLAHNWIRRKAYPCSQASTQANPPRAKGDGELLARLLMLSLSELPKASTSFELMLLGTKGNSGTIVIPDLLKASAVQENELFIKVMFQDVGDIVGIAFEAKGAPSCRLETLRVVHQRGVESFIVGASLDERGDADNIKGYTGKNITGVLHKRIESQLEQKRALYTWTTPVDGLPSFAHYGGLEKVPEWDQYPIRNQVFAGTHTLEALRKRGDKDQKRVRNFSEIERMVRTRYAKCLPPDEMFREWQSDGHFAEQFVAGAHPDVIRLCNDLPTCFPSEEVEGVFAGALTLEEAIAKEQVYIADYRFLTGLTERIPPAVVLFHQQPGVEGLRPIAIQLDTEGQGVVFTPDDSPTDWLAAKMWARLADTNVCGMGAHLLFSHQVMASFHTAVQRNIPEQHPVYQILLPHLRNVIAAAMVGHDVLLAEGGFFHKITAMGDCSHELGRLTWKHGSLKQKLDMPYDLEQRGVSDTKELPYYPYRDDGLLIWQAIEAFVREALEVHYKEDEDVLQDTYLQNFMHEAVHVGLPGCDLDEHIPSFEALVKLVAGLIFASSAGHAVINSQMFKQMAFVPNSPWRLDGDFPRQRGVQHKEIISWLPERLTLERTVDMMAILGLREVPGFFTTDESVLGEDDLHSSHPGVRKALARFRDTLKRTEDTIRARNEKRKMSYDAFLNEHLTASASW